MAFAMSLPRTKRVKYFNPDGTEVFQEEDRWSLVRAVHSNHQEDEKGASGDGKAAEQPGAAPVLPLEALEKLRTARGEVNMMLDLIDSLEQQQHMAIANIPPQKSTLQQLTRQRDLRLQSRARQLRDAAQRLKGGAGALRAHLSLEDRYFGEVAQLASDWHIRPAPDFNFASGAAPYQAELRIAGARLPSSATTSIDLWRTPGGAVQVAGKSGSVVTGPSAAHPALLELQRDLLWAGLRTTLNEEAQASASSGAAQGLVIEVLQAAQSSEHPDLQELGALLLRAYLAGLAEAEKTGVAAKLLPRANAWLRHRWFAGFVRRSLEEQASHLKGSIDQKVHLDPVEVPGPARSAITVRIGDRSVLLVVRNDTLEVRGIGQESAQACRWVNAGVLANVGKQEIGSLLARLVQE